MKKTVKYFAITCLIILLISGIIMMFSGKDNWVNKYNLIGCAFAVEFVYSMACLRRVEVDQVGLLLLFGRPIDKVKSGLVFVLLGFVSLKKETILVIQDELPADPEKIWRTKEGEGNVPMTKGYFPPIRITFGQPDYNKYPDLKDSPYNIQMTVEVTPVIRWRIIDLEVFVSTIGTIEKARKQMEDTCIAEFNANFAQITPAVALKNLDKYSNQLKISIEEEVRGWGIEVINAQIKPFNFSHGLNKAVVGVSEAILGAKSMSATADGEKTRIEKQGEGTAKAELLIGETKAKVEKLIYEAKAFGMGKLAKQAGTDEGKLVIWLQTMQEAIQKANYTIIPGGELFSAVSGLEELFKRVKEGGKK
ncbi:MAG TPA: SPFH domain-containing protein [Candidatus Paceibacterota bacterium]|nr:SPFH domain-containing protein [Candidatus Paceibacterota bacterium]HPT18185.1 SPFH domain-containing protein [Candidatus Paceibacterota bacterium]